MLQNQLSTRVQSASDPYSAMGGLIDVVRDFLSDITIPMPPRDEVLEWVGTTYDAVIAPMDIPVIGPFIEAKVDAMLREILIKQVGVLYDNLQRRRVNSQRAAA